MNFVDAKNKKNKRVLAIIEIIKKRNCEIN